MTPTEKFSSTRAKIVAALEAAGIASGNIKYRRDYVPTTFPAAQVVLEGETGILPTSRQFRDTEIDWVIYLIADAHEQKVSDPDLSLYQLKEAVRAQYIERLHKDFPSIDYYTSMAEARKVKIAKISTRRGA